MNLIDVTVVRIVEPPHRVENHWEVEIEIEDDGGRRVRTVQAWDQRALAKYVPGYSWSE